MSLVFSLVLKKARFWKKAPFVSVHFAETYVKSKFSHTKLELSWQKLNLSAL